MHFATALCVIGLIPTRDNTLCDPAMVALTLGVLYICNIYICKVPRNIYNPNVGFIFINKKNLFLKQ